MRKFMWVLLGLVLVFGALGMVSWRHVLDPQQKARIYPRAVTATPSTTRGIGEQQRPFTDRRPAGTATAPSSTDTAPGSWQMAEMVLNALNVIVGLIGIWMAWVGMRMQREASAQMARARSDR